MHKSKQAKHELIMSRYLDFHEAKVRRGSASPFSGIERATIEMVFIWICTNYKVTSS